jgi:hypothetical protein
VRIAPYFVLGQEVLVLLQLLLVTLEVLHHEVLARELVVIGEMVDDLVVGESDACVGALVPDLGLKRLRTVQTVAQ